MKKTTIFIIVAIIIVFALTIAIAVGSMGFANWDVQTWFNNWGQSNNDIQDNPSYEDTIDIGGAVVEYENSNGIQISSAKLPVSAYAANGISPLADTAYKLTATIKPDTAVDKTIKWTVEWANSDSTWARDKSVTDYVTVSPTTDGALTANLTCLKAFSEPINVKATSSANSAAYATCKVDYAQRLQSTRFNFTGLGYSISLSSQNVELEAYALFVGATQGFARKYGPNVNNVFEYQYSYGGDYTIANNVLSSKFEIKASSELKTALSAVGLNCYATDWVTIEDFSYCNILWGLCGMDQLGDQAIWNTANYEKLLTAFGKTTTCDFQVRITSSCLYGGNVETLYNCHYSHSTAALVADTVTLSNGNIIL